MKDGKVTGNVLKRSVLRQIKTKRTEVIKGAGIGEDCAFFAPFSGKGSAACVQEAAVAVPADIGLLIMRCVNSLAASKAEPVAALLSIALPKEAEEPLLKELMQCAEERCAALGIEIAGGHTTVTDAVKLPFVTVTTVGNYTENQKERGRQASKAAPGQDILVSKWVGLEGTALLAREYKEVLLQRYPSWLWEEAAGFLQYQSILPEAAVAAKSGACAMHDISEGGILAALWELGEGTDVGLTIDIKKIPIRQETVEVCELTGANPYALLSGGSLLMTAADGLGLKAALEEAGIPAAIIGKVTDSHDRLLINEEEARYLDRPQPDEIYAAFGRKMEKPEEA